MAAIAVPAGAEGYQVNTLSAKQNGMGHTGTALKLGSESMIFNPAGMAFMEDQIDFSGSFTAIMPTATATVNGKKYESDNPASTPLAFNLGFSVYDKLKAGISFYTPYGSNIDWGENWAGAMLNQRVKLAVYTVQPTVAWRITPKLSVGAGLTIAWGSVNLDKALVAGLPLVTGNTAIIDPDIAAASVNLNGTSRVAIGANIGVMYDINEKWNVGASYRSRMDMKVKSGIASVTYANDTYKAMLGQTLGLIHEANFAAQMPCVSIISLGTSFKPVQKLTLAFDAQLSLWSEYKKLDIEFTPEALSVFDQHIAKNYRNAWMFHLGAEYDLTQRFDIRAGLILDTTPIRKDNYNPETPGMTKIEPSVGFSFRPVKNFSIDASLMYVAGLGRNDASIQYVNMLTKQPETFTADYKVSAFCPSVGVTLRF